jgi:hypothetical protein
VDRIRKKHKATGTERSVYIFVDEKGQIQQKDDNGELSAFDGNVSLQNGRRLFYFYSQQFTVGVDIPQPAILKGITIVNRNLRRDEVAQAVFRMRNMSRGHRTDFLVTDNSEETAVEKTAGEDREKKDEPPLELVPRNDLLLHTFWRNADLARENMMPLLLMQNLKTLQRQEMLAVNGTFNSDFQQFYTEKYFYQPLETSFYEYVSKFGLAYPLSETFAGIKRKLLHHLKTSSQQDTDTRGPQTTLHEQVHELQEEEEEEEEEEERQNVSSFKDGLYQFKGDWCENAPNKRTLSQWLFHTRYRRENRVRDELRLSVHTYFFDDWNDNDELEEKYTFIIEAVRKSEDPHERPFVKLVSKEELPTAIFQLQRIGLKFCRSVRILSRNGGILFQQPRPPQEQKIIRDSDAGVTNTGTLLAMCLAGGTLSIGQEVLVVHDVVQHLQSPEIFKRWRQFFRQCLHVEYRRSFLSRTLEGTESEITAKVAKIHMVLQSEGEVFDQFFVGFPLDPDLRTRLRENIQKYLAFSNFSNAATTNASTLTPVYLRLDQVPKLQRFSTTDTEAGGPPFGGDQEKKTVSNKNTNEDRFSSWSDRFLSWSATLPKKRSYNLLSRPQKLEQGQKKTGSKRKTVGE